MLALFWGLALIWSYALAVAQPRAPNVRYEPSPDAVVQAMTDLAAVQPRDVVYDLGCGDGRVVIAAARLGARAVCIDIDPLRITEAQQNARQAGVAERIDFRTQDLFAADLSDATVVMLFLSADFNLALRERLRGLKAGTRVVSHWHDMGNWKAQKAVRVRSGWREHPVYLWVTD